MRPNLTASPRSGTISLGAEAFTVNQEAAGPVSALNPLSFKPIAAAYDKPLDKIVMVNTSPNELHIYDPVSQADQIVPLNYIPLSLSLRPDGLFAAVGHSGQISIVDLQGQTVLQTIPVDMDNGGIALAGNGYAYTFPSQGYSSGTVDSVQLSTGTLSTLQGGGYGNIPRLDASGNYLYVSSLGEGTSKLNISNGPATLVTDLLSTFTGNIWLSEEGNRLITSGGRVFFTAVDPAQDLQPDGTLSGATTVDWAAESQIQQQIAVLTDPSASLASNTVLQIYANNGLLLESQTALPGFSNNGTSYASHGRYLFWNAAASKLFSITEADSTSGLLSDYAIYTLTMPESLPACTYAVSPTSINATPSFSSWVVHVTSNCSWSPTGTSSSWFGPESSGATNGNGEFTVNVDSNLGAPRSGSIAVGNQTVTVNQSASTCTYQLSSTTASFSQLGGTGTVNLTTGASCYWSVQSNSSWVNITSNSYGTGSASIQFSVGPATAPSLYQYATLNIAGLTFAITQTETGATKTGSFAVWRPSSGTWFVLPSASPGVPVTGQWGAAGDIPVPGDYDADGKPDYAVWRPSTGTWFVLPSANPEVPIVLQWGVAGDIPVPGDYDGDGKIDYAVWRPSTGTWFVLPSANPEVPIVLQWGVAGDIPVPGDYDGDGKIDYAVWRPSTGTWFILPSANPGMPLIRQWGAAGDIPVPGDYDGDGKTDSSVWRPSTGTWFILPSANPGMPIVQQWGQPGDVPTIGDFNGDGRADFTVWRPSDGTWFVLHNSASSFPISNFQQQWGSLGDVPVQANF